MTIKTQGGKVITKGGKVSCSCCEEPECCMYPAAGLGVDYTEDDLPDAVTYDGETLTRTGSGYAGGIYNLNVVNGEWVIEDGDGNSCSGPCLIGDSGDTYTGVCFGSVEDQFLDTYTVTTEDRSYIVTRKSLCVWATEIDPENPNVGDGVLGYSEVGIFGSPQWTFQDTPDGFFAFKSELSNPTDGWGSQLTVS